MAPPPNRRLTASAGNLIECLARTADLPQPHVNPTRNGGVQFEWEAGDRYFELEVVAEGEAAYYWRDHSKADQQEGTVFVGERLDRIRDFIRSVGA